MQWSTAACFAAVAFAAHAATGTTGAAHAADAALIASTPRCGAATGARGKPCDQDAAPAPRARRDEARVYADARSTRLRNRAYLRAAAVYCERYSGRVRAACVDEAEAIYQP
ncbi:hypothetical protein Tbd_2261 [Thiobacillus denitrificans ATCC 25259]|uniref:Uncharacterized protein n=1 Tax=Thiobacillus denitrificans (strain ATCC 25259 / T1) TaxID=292415 RepID=Q3SGN3_THIDA|nr:hypothetical protein [Thiobacillus denitrificans]AAZ98214.1 hypothetical protein Tbd_2261 [Thiobacillus denitrificans ATCC 25259]